MSCPGTASRREAWELGAGNFDDDSAADHLSIVTGKLVEEIETAMADPETIEPDEYWGVAVPCNLELLHLIAKRGAAPDALAASLAVVERAVVEVVHPLLQTVATVRELVAGYEDGRLGSVALNIKNDRIPHDAINVAFGYGADTFRNMAGAYRQLGRLADGRRRVMAYLEGIGNGQSAFVQELRAEAEACFSDER